MNYTRSQQLLDLTTSTVVDGQRRLRQDGFQATILRRHEKLLSDVRSQLVLLQGCLVASGELNDGQVGCLG